VRQGSRAVRVAHLRSRHRPVVISPVSGASPPTADTVRRIVDDLLAAGHSRVVTPALDRREREPFLAAGGTVIDELHLLSRSLDAAVDHPSEPTTRRARRRDWGPVEALDERAFDAFWHFGADELADAIAATPAARFRVVGSTHPWGYAVCGRAGSEGFVQRLAVDPARQGCGVGSALLLDGLRWLRRRGARRALVNTQRVNERALTLYRRHGFELEPSGLSVVGFAGHSP
jgi:GNAT superfamily N-acetyltransferase